MSKRCRIYLEDYEPAELAWYLKKALTSDDLYLDWKSKEEAAFGPGVATLVVGGMTSFASLVSAILGFLVQRKPSSTVVVKDVKGRTVEFPSNATDEERANILKFLTDMEQIQITVKREAD
jgi:hypothetical protein